MAAAAPFFAACNVKCEIAAYFNCLKILHGFRSQDFLQILLLCVYVHTGPRFNAPDGSLSFHSFFLNKNTYLCIV